MAVKFTDQATEIMAICARLGLEPHVLGERAGIEPETMRKYARGYQKASNIVMHSLRNVERMQMLMKDTGRSPKKTDSSRSHIWVETQTLDRTLNDLSSRLLKAQAADRKFIIGNIREVLDELESREMGVLTEAQEIAARSSAPSSASGEGTEGKAGERAGRLIQEHASQHARHK